MATATAALSPWLSPLHGLLALRAPDTERPRVATVSVLAPLEAEATASRLGAVRDALVILSALARVDRQAWARALGDCCGLDLSNYDASVTLPDALPAERFSLVLGQGWGGGELDVPNDGAWDVGGFSRLWAAPPTEALDGALEAIANLYPELRSQQLDVPITIVVRSGAYSPSARVERYLNALQAQCDEGRGWRLPVSNAGGKCALVVDTVALDLSGPPVTRGMARAICELVARGNGLMLSPVKLLISPIMEGQENARPLDAHTFAELARQLLLLPQQVTGGRATLGSVSFDSVIGAPGTFARLCSALAETQTSDTVELFLSEGVGEVEVEVDEWVWARVAYAFFSSHAREHSKITNLTIRDAVMTEAHAEAIADVLAATHPASQLFGCHGAPITGSIAPKCVMLRQGTTVKILPMHPAERISRDKARVVLARDVSAVSVLGAGDVTGSVMALLPGYGRCVVDRDQCVEVGEVGGGGSARGSGGITSLTLECADFADEEGAVEGLPRFVQLVGSTLTRLVLHVPEESTLGSALVLESCPCLQVLAIHGIKLDADAFLRAYNAHGLRIQELCCQFYDVAPVTRELQDKDAALTRSLKKFEYSAEIWRRHDKASELDAILAMLRVNRSLEHVRIRVSDDAYYLCVDAVGKYDQESLPVAREPFPVANRIAFLSIFNPRQPPKEQAAKSAKMTTPEASVPDAFRPPRLAMAIIFAFAAERLCRRVEMPQQPPEEFE